MRTMILTMRTILPLFKRILKRSKSFPGRNVTTNDKKEM